MGTGTGSEKALTYWGESNRGELCGAAAGDVVG